MFLFKYTSMFKYVRGVLCNGDVGMLCFCLSIRERDAKNMRLR